MVYRGVLQVNDLLQIDVAVKVKPPQHTTLVIIFIMDNFETIAQTFCLQEKPANCGTKAANVLAIFLADKL